MSFKVGLNERQLITLAIIVGGFLIIFTPLFNLVFGLLFAGYIPGTDLTIPWPLMLAGYLTAGFFTLRYAKRHGLYPGSAHIKKARGELIAEDISITTTHASFDEKPVSKVVRRSTGKPSAKRKPRTAAKRKTAKA